MYFQGAPPPLRVALPPLTLWVAPAGPRGPPLPTHSTSSALPSQVSAA